MTAQSYNQMKQEMSYLFYITSKEVISQYNNKLKAYGISFPNFIVLLYIEKDKPIYINTLCKELYLDSGTISPIMKRLEKKKLIQRIRAEEDERRVMIKLTEQGAELKEHFSQITDDVVDEFGMDKEDSLAYYEILKTFAKKNIYNQE
ncbi:MarR family winged helix-turn-helix transcriptional regulator [Staphylococcus hsinchuensis]|uniref:HTH-type transcriptional regulator SarZ n=1 Tax=Staphylococcus hsinchuensis TaxID=3051183 RepID=A0ABZ3EAJ8_9STAP